MAWWATNYRGPATDEEASAQARQRPSQMLADLAALGVPAEGDLITCQLPSLIATEQVPRCGGGSALWVIGSANDRYRGRARMAQAAYGRALSGR